MSDWQIRRLDEYIADGEIILGRGNIISKDDIDAHPGPYPIYSSSAHNNGKFGEYAKFMFNEELVTWSVDGGGSLFYRPKHKFSVTNVCGFMRVKASYLDAQFIYYCLSNQHKYMTFDYTSKAHPSVIKKLYSLPNIDLKIQQKIAHVLAVIDETIEKIELLIEKYQQIKIGLMQDLFTQGIGSDGKLRPPREQAPNLYHDSDLGWLPIGWRCDTLENVLATVPNNMRSGPFGSALLKSELVEDGIPFLGIDNIHIEKFVPNYKRFVSERKFNELNKYAVRPKDVVITIMGTVGRSAVIPDNIEKALSSKHLWTMTLDADKVIPELICWQLNYASWVKSWFRRETQGGIMDAIQSKTLKKLKLPFPPIDEQNEILKRYAAITNKIVSEQNKLNKYNKIKVGLMDDLLTGKNAVSTQDDEAVCV
ncbi:restriction endonuclease subunit S [Pseudoalteromonas sp. SG43-6]|uniref:restriction endonuclease subunit S n=1 Tax=Pseudoalteromonas sp. SG43-6 TaxID=2760967 RepID=UPI001603B4AA|nr:restriction endonuclease subunit S [Pseudoalteromonas sp. SG43-6]MBB1435724.1 restriction endonuclease subunit S [Pseudoalteromonas sp. SG43-6]